MLMMPAASDRAAKMPVEEARDLIRRMADEAFNELSRRGERRFSQGHKGSLLYTLYIFLSYGRSPPGGYAGNLSPPFVPILNPGTLCSTALKKESGGTGG